MHWGNPTKPGFLEHEHVQSMQHQFTQEYMLPQLGQDTPDTIYDGTIDSIEMFNTSIKPDVLSVDTIHAAHASLTAAQLTGSSFTTISHDDMYDSVVDIKPVQTAPIPFNDGVARVIATMFVNGSKVPEGYYASTRPLQEDPYGTTVEVRATGHDEVYSFSKEVLEYRPRPPRPKPFTI